MFKKRELQVKLVKSPKEDTHSSTTEGRLHIDFEQISNIALKQVRNAAVIGVAGVVVLKVTDAACEIAKIVAAK